MVSLEFTSKTINFIKTKMENTVVTILLQIIIFPLILFWLINKITEYLKLIETNTKIKKARICFLLKYSQFK